MNHSCLRCGDSAPWVITNHGGSTVQRMEKLLRDRDCNGNHVCDGSVGGHCCDVHQCYAGIRESCDGQHCEEFDCTTIYYCQKHYDEGCNGTIQWAKGTRDALGERPIKCNRLRRFVEELIAQRLRESFLTEAALD